MQLLAIVCGAGLVVLIILVVLVNIMNPFAKPNGRHRLSEMQTPIYFARMALDDTGIALLTKPDDV